MDIKRVAVVTGLALATWVVVTFAVIGSLFVYDRVMDPSEDSGDYALNCYIYGEGTCGPTAPWHGFINLF